MWAPILTFWTDFVLSPQLAVTIDMSLKENAKNQISDNHDKMN